MCYEEECLSRDDRSIKATGRYSNSEFSGCIEEFSSFIEEVKRREGKDVKKENG